MNKLSLSMFLMITLSFFLYAEDNHTQETNATVEHNSSVQTEQKHDTNKTIIKSKLEEQQVKEQMAREEEYAQSQSFLQGDDYDLKAVEVNLKSLENIPSIEPDYDFDMTDVYRDDI